MRFKIDQTKRPKVIKEDGIVIFEHYTRKSAEGPDQLELTETTPTKEECLAYGFRYNDVTNECLCKSAGTFEYMSTRAINTTNDTGFRNAVDIDLIGRHINGKNNSLNESTNCAVNGTFGVVNTGCVNSTIMGTRANATIPNHYVHGGSLEEDILGERQYTRVLFGVTSTAGSTINSHINNDGTNFYPVPTNSIMYFNASVVAVCTSSEAEGGGVGDFCSWLERGVIINRNGTMQIKRTRKTMSNHGSVSNWRPTAATSGTHFKITVRGETGKAIEWTATVDFTEFRSSTSLASG